MCLVFFIQNNFNNFMILIKCFCIKCYNDLEEKVKDKIMYFYVLLSIILNASFAKSIKLYTNCKYT